MKPNLCLSESQRLSSLCMATAFSRYRQNFARRILIAFGWSGPVTKWQACQQVTLHALSIYTAANSCPS